MINARVHSDDFVYDVRFDATPWFQRAKTREIVDLIACEWGGDYPADWVAECCRDTSPEVAEVFDYVDRKNDSQVGETIGFECHVDEQQAVDWLQANRPQVYESLKKEGLL